MMINASMIRASTRLPSSYALKICRRYLNLHEYQSKALMSRYQVATQKFELATTAEEAEMAFEKLDVPEVVLKAQIHAGGRGKGRFTSGFQGGVKLSTDASQVKSMAFQMLGYNLITKQTSAEGVPVRKLMVAEALNIKRETYFAILADRSSESGIAMVGSPKGGMDIEAVAEETPDLIFKESIDIVTGPTRDQTERMAENLGFHGELRAQASQQMQNLYRMFIEVDATQVEINPLGETDDGKVVSFDAKINFDDNAEFRQKAIFSDRDTTEEDPREVKARESHLNYIGMDGNIGCLVNGAGLAMATMDIIKLHGGIPANFLDIGGSANENQVKEAFKIITSDSRVKAVLVNIFGGIMRCDTIASGIVAAAKEIQMDVPLVVRLSGTNVEAGKLILKQSGLPIIAADNLDEAALKAVGSLSSN